MEENKNNEIEMNSEVKQTNAQSVKTKKKSKVVPVLVTIILILVLALVLCIGNMYAMTNDYDNVFAMVSSMISGEEEIIEEKNETSEDVKTEQEDNEISNILEDKNKDYVYERESYDFEYSYQNELNKKKIERLYINIDSEDTRKANQEIYTMYEAATKSVSNIKEMGGYYDLDYEYNIIGNLLCLRVSNWWVQIGSSGTFEDTIYYFDLETGKRLSLDDVMKELNLTEEKLIQKINLHLKEKYKDSNETGITEQEYIESFEYDIKEVYFKSENMIEIVVDSGYIMQEMHMEINLKEENNSNVVEEEVQSIIQGFLNINKYYMGHPSAVLVEFGYVEDVYEYGRNSTRTNEGWLVSNSIKYSDFKNKMLEYMTEELYQEEFKFYKDVNGYLALDDNYGKTGNEARVNKIELVTLENNLYTFMVESKGYYKQPGGDTEEYDIKSKFEVQKNESGKYVVSKYEEL